jgi:Nif-specific regulatory protein
MGIDRATLREQRLLVAIGRALQGDFQPRSFLDELSAELCLFVPHDHLSISYLADDRRTFSRFAEQVAPALLPLTEHYTTDLDRPDRFLVRDSPLAPVFEGETLCASDGLVDPRVAEDAARLRAAGLRSAVWVPLLTGTRVIGAFCALSRVAGAFDDVHCETLRSVGRLIGPFIDTIAVLYRERRRRHRVALLSGITQMLGTTLEVHQVLAPLERAIRPALDFDAMGIVLLTSGSPDYKLFGVMGEPPDPAVYRLSTTDFSSGESVKAGRPFLVREAAKEFDVGRAGDRAILGVGLNACLWVPMRFADEIGGALFFGKHEPHWYDDEDVEVATLVASRLVLAIQHQRLAEDQRRLASAARRAQTLEQSLKSARRELQHRYGFEQIIGRSPLLRTALTSAAQVAPTETTVLITGESGTGKELVARAIHYASRRADGPLVAVNCAALPDTLLESELFGHERGAFTGADRQKPGRFELAAGGTLFLDEIGDLSALVQVKLLRVLQEREYQRVGGTATLKADVRLIAATNRDLTAEMAAGRFRSDLFYRLNVFNVHLPPLRERGDDVPLLGEQFIRDLSATMGKGDVMLSREAADALRRHLWPGNIRELQNAIERALITCEDTLITAAHLGLRMGAEDPVPPPSTPAPPSASAGSLQELERAAIQDALRRTHGHKSRAAALLGITRFQLHARLKRLRIDVPRK